MLDSSHQDEVVHECRNAAGRFYEAGAYAMAAAQDAGAAALALSLPSVLYRPKLYPDGDRWCALYGDDLQMGVAGFGVTPDAAMADFDKNWNGQTLHRAAALRKKVKP